MLLPDLGGGGAERVAVTLANGFARRGHIVELVLMRPEGVLRDLVHRDVRIVDLKAPRIRQVPTRFAAYLRENKPDGVLAFMWPLTVAAVLARIIARSPARLVLSDHSTLGRQYPGKRVQQAIRWTVRRFYPHAVARTTVSEGATADLASLSGLASDQFEVLSNPLDLPPLPLARSDEVEGQWGGDGRRILSLGSLKPEKDQTQLLRAFARMPAGDRLMIVGEGAERRQLESLTKELGIADRVVMPGFRIDPWPFLASADLFVLSSRFEGLPLVLVEALHAGLRIVSTDCPSGPREILEGGRYGELVPVGDADQLAEAMERALASVPDRESLRRRARQLASHATIDRYLELLLGRTNGAPGPS